MKPGVLCNYGYKININDYDTKTLNEITNDLFILPQKNAEYGGASADDAIRIFLKNGNFMYLPKFYGRKKIGLEKNDDHGDSAVAIENVTFNKKNFTFGDRQKAIIKATLSGVHEHGGGILRAGTGAGKTVVALYCALKFGLRTLVIVPRLDLRKQWVDEANVALIGATIKVLENVDSWQNVMDADFIFVNMHCYAMHKWPMEFLKTIGMVVIDEVHVFATNLFSKCFTHYCPKYILALSATSLRIDRQDVMINYFCGESLYSDNFQHNNRIHAIILYWSTKLHAREIVQKYDDTYAYGIVQTQELGGKKRPNHSLMVADVIANPIRNQKIVDLAINLANGIDVDNDNGHIINHKYRTLIVSNRIDHLQNLRRMILKKDPDASTGLLIGSMKEEESAESKTKQILLGNLQCVRDGLSIMTLDAMIIAVSVKNTKIEDDEGNSSEAWKQLIGRILRKEHKKPIFVYYIADSYGHFRMHTNSVKEFFSRNKMIQIHERKLTRESQHIPLYSVAKKTIPMLFSISNDISEDENQKNIEEDWD